VFFGVNLNADQCTVGAIDMRSKVLRQNTELVSGRTPDEVLDAVADTIFDQMDALALQPNRVRGVGMSVPGAVDSGARLIPSVSGMDDWRGKAVGSMLSQRLEMPVHVESVANALALEEQYFGRQGDNFILIHAAETVSVGVVVRGDLYRGLPDFPVNLGQCPIDTAGGHCLDELLSVPALLKDTGCRTWEELMSRSDSVQVVERLADALTPCVANVIHAFRLENVIISGPLGHCSMLRDRLNESVRSICRFPIESGPVHPCTVSTPVRMAASPAYHTLFVGGTDSQLLPVQD
jgi:predicted NBD/HSP70 family sugar kinase